MKAVFIWATLTLATTVSAGATNYDLFIATKTMNSHNSLVFEARVSDCRLAPTNPIVVKWILGRQNYRREDINIVQRQFIGPKILHQSPTELDFTFNMMERYQYLLPDDRITVRLEGCQPKAFFKTSQGEVQFLSLHTEVRAGKPLPEPDYLLIEVKNKSGRKYKIRIDN